VTSDYFKPTTSGFLFLSTKQPAEKVHTNHN